MVSRTGHHPVYAGDGSEAVALAHSPRPAMIFLDVVMPPRTASRPVAPEGRPQDGSHPRRAGHLEEGRTATLWGKKQGADDLVGKPYTPEQMVDLIRRYVR